jgi:hypothetical protein
MDPTINAMMKQKQEKLILLAKLERKNSFLRDKIFEEKENMKNLKKNNFLLNILVSKLK